MVLQLHYEVVARDFCSGNSVKVVTVAVRLV